MEIREFGLPGAAFGPGPWVGEPGRLEWDHAGMRCLLRRNMLGVWCGYVAVPPGHPWHGQRGDAVDAEVHGYLSYADSCRGEPGDGICHVPHPGEPDDVWWLGFDCGHTFDVIPAWANDKDKLFRDLARDGEYKTMEFAKAEAERLADQAREAQP